MFSNICTKAKCLHTIIPFASIKTRDTCTFHLHNRPMRYVLNTIICERNYNSCIKTNVQKRLNSSDAKFGPYGTTRLIEECANGSIEHFKLLIQNKIDLNAKDRLGKTALMYAVINNRPEAVELLIKNKANLNITDSEGKTALMYAELNNRLDIFKLLISGMPQNAFHITNDVGNDKEQEAINVAPYASYCITNDVIVSDRKQEDVKQGVINKHSRKLVLFEGGVFVFDPLLIEDFNPTRSVATCYILRDEKMLLLKRNGLSILGNTWSMPGGKLEENETPLTAIVREIKEETGILFLPEEINPIITLYVRIHEPKQDYLLHIFKTVLNKSFRSPNDKVLLNNEHTDYVWVDPVKAQEMNLLPAGKEIIQFIYLNFRRL